MRDTKRARIDNEQYPQLMFSASLRNITDTGYCKKAELLCLLMKMGLVEWMIPDAQKWNIYDDNIVSVIEDGKVVMQKKNHEWSMTHTGTALTEGRHYWEVEVLVRGYAMIGVCIPSADTRQWHGKFNDTTAWLMDTSKGALWGNGKSEEDAVGGFKHKDRMGILLDLDEGSLLFFKNGVQHGPGYPPDSVTGPVALGVQMVAKPYVSHTSTEEPKLDMVRLLPGAEWPAGHAP